MADGSDLDGAKIHAEQVPMLVEEVHHQGSWNISSDLPPGRRADGSVREAHRERLSEVRGVHQQDFVGQREENGLVPEDDSKKLRRGAPIPIGL